MDGFRLIWTHRGTFIDGTWTTIVMALFAMAIATVLGIIFGLISTSGKIVPRGFARAYVEFFQNTPVMLQAMFLFYAVVFAGVRGFSPLLCGIITLGVYHGAYIAEVIRAGILSIDKGQIEAAYSQGFTYIGAMTYIIIPQTFKIVLPPFVNQVVNLIKNTSCMYLAGGALDLISRTTAFAVGEGTGSASAQAYIIGGVIFFVICFPLSTLAAYLENKLKARDTSVVLADVAIAGADMDPFVADTIATQVTTPGGNTTHE